MLLQHKQVCRMFLNFRNARDNPGADMDACAIYYRGWHSLRQLAVRAGRPSLLVILLESQRAFCRFALNCREYQVSPTIYRLKTSGRMPAPKSLKSISTNVFLAREPICYLGHSCTNCCRVVLKFNIVLCILSRKNSSEKIL